MAQPIPPIFIFSGNDLMIFDDLSKAEGWLEPIDIQNKEHEAYDAAGHRLALSGELVASIFLHEQRYYRDELAARLARFSSSVGTKIEASANEWEEFVSEAAAKLAVRK